MVRGLSCKRREYFLRVNDLEAATRNPSLRSRRQLTPARQANQEHHHRSRQLQNSDQSGDYRHRYVAWLWRGVAGDLDVVSPLSAGEIAGPDDLATGNDSATSGQTGAIDWQRRGQRIGFTGNCLSRSL